MNNLDFINKFNLQKNLNINSNLTNFKNGIKIDKETLIKIKNEMKNKKLPKKVIFCFLIIKLILNYLNNH